ncbi:MAG: protein kinase domain-containing protein [Arachnia sp.]
MDKIGRYRITGRIGSGSFATVFRGHDESLDVPVAVKVLSPDWIHNPDVQERFLSEARILRRLDDERIVRVYDIGTTPSGQPYFVMDLADGGSLEQLRRRPVAPGLALRLAAEAARAVDVMHRNALVHRDVAPGNILLRHTSSGARVLLADLGVASSLVEADQEDLTAGTPAYMAPQQASSTRPERSSDIYSLAAVTYALLTSRPPFPATSLADVLARDPGQGPLPIAAQLGAPEVLDQVLTASLSADPAQRPATASQLADALDRLADQLPGGDELRPSRPAPNEHIPDRRPPTEPTPGEMLDGYLGPGRYRPRPTKETYSPWFYVWLTGTAIVLAGLAAWITIGFLLG